MIPNTPTNIFIACTFLALFTAGSLLYLRWWGLKQYRYKGYKRIAAPKNGCAFCSRKYKLNCFWDEQLGSCFIEKGDEK